MPSGPAALLGGGTLRGHGAQWGAQQGVGFVLERVLENPEKGGVDILRFLTGRVVEVRKVMTKHIFPQFPLSGFPFRVWG